MILSKRLQMVADCVTKDFRVADVGCDHAYLSIALIRSGICPHAIAMDINEGPLLRAKENINNAFLNHAIEIRLSAGVLQLVEGEVESIVIAGMGGGLIVQILEEGCALLSQVKELILQPQSEVYKVRRYLHKIGFRIVFENMCIDDEKFYVVIKAIQKRTNNFEKSYKDSFNQAGIDEKLIKILKEEYGAYLLHEKHPVLHKLLIKELKKNETILMQLKEHVTSKSLLRQKECEEEINKIKMALSLIS